MTISLLIAFATAARPPAVAERPAPTARAAAERLIDSGLIIQAMFRGRAAGMFKAIDAQKQIDDEIQKMLKSREVKAFLLDRSISEERRVRRLFRWLLHRPPKPDEMKVVRKFVGKAKDRHKGYTDVIWSIYNSSEFLRGPARAAAKK